KGNAYEPRSATQIEEIRHQLAVAERKERERAEFFARLQQALDGEVVAWAESDRTRLEALERCVLQPEQEVRVAKELLAELKRQQTPQAAFELLVDLGVWSPHENLFLRRSSYPNQFPQKVLTLAREYLVTPPSDRDGDTRFDLTHLKTYTIDDESTREIDDGLSVELLENGLERIWIHIADPTRLVAPDDEIDLEARKRGTTLYLPTGSTPMFPHELATGPMSLVQGQVCPALSFGVLLDETGEIVDYSIQVSCVQPTYRLTYDDVDEMLELDLEAEPEIRALAKWAQKRRDWRRSQGAVEISLPEAAIKVDAAGEVAIEILADSGSRQLVAEMMILTGEVAGRFASDRDVPLVFRGQPEPELPPEEELLQLPAGPVRSCAVRSCMARSETGILPTRHSGLGLDTYTQVTSPIRRYADLLAHYQLKAHLRGEEPPFSRDRVQEIAYSASASAYEATLVERQTKRYWALEFLSRHADEVWSALVLRWLRPDDNLGIILLEDLALELPHRFGREVNLGDRLDVRVFTVDPHQDLIRFREVNEATIAEAEATAAEPS
ncbi:MAG: ribonuclease R family protein, partial [Cyanobacteria bacterium J06641_5]